MAIKSWKGGELGEPMIGIHISDLDRIWEIIQAQSDDPIMDLYTIGLILGEYRRNE